MKNKKYILAALAAMLSLSIFAQTQTVRAFSHRGGRLEYDENTLSAFQASLDLGYSGFETDISMTRDGVLIIFHDSKLDRTTNGTGLVLERDWNYIKGLETKGGHKIPTLEELAKFFSDKHIEYVEWELKSTRYLSQERMEKYCDQIYDIITRYKPDGAEYLVTSSDPKGLLYLKSKHPDLPLLIIFGKPVNEETINTALALGIDRIGCVMDGTSREMVAKAKSKGLRVSLWPTHKIEDFVLGCYLGAEFLCNDIPGKVKETMSKDFPWIKIDY